VTELPIPHLDALGSIAPGLLYPHQADGVAFLISKGRAILGDDMGLGKTRQTVGPVLAKFYNSLSDEQKARFNSLRSASRPAG